MKRIEIESRRIGPEEPVFIIAEVGVNHNGDPEMARQMIDMIADAGADCVKFQTFTAEDFCNSSDEVYTYKSQGKEVEESMLGMFKRLELKYEEFNDLFSYARKRGLIPLSTPTDYRAVAFLDEIGSPAFKVGSDDLVYTPFLEHVARKGKPMIISTGMAEMADVERAVATIQGAGNDQIVILHCVSLYPAPEDQVNLRKITTLRMIFDKAIIGFSDHSEGITACLGAVALGANVLEKHFTLDRNLPGPDHWFSADPAELNALVHEVRRLERSLGSGSFKPSREEIEMAHLCRRSIVAARDIKSGNILCTEDIAFKRPGTGLMPYELPKVIGNKARHDLPNGTTIYWHDLEKNDD